MAGPAVIVNGVAIILGGIGIAAGIWIDISALVIAVFLFFTTFFIHSSWKETDQMARMMDMTQFQKDIALLGASLVFFAVAAYGGGSRPLANGPAAQPVTGDRHPPGPGQLHVLRRAASLVTPPMLPKVETDTLP
jgi:hypothetical protein